MILIVCSLLFAINGGNVYTTYSQTDRKNNKGKGWVRFFDESFVNADGSVINPRELTNDMLNYMKSLHEKDIIGLTAETAEGAYANDGFKNGRTMFAICQSGGLTDKDLGNFDIRTHAIPYKDATHKNVVSQNINLALFKKGNEIAMQKSFNSMVALTRGDIQGSWAAETGFFPSAKSATNSKIYQDFLTESQPTKIQKLYQESAKLNDDIYKDDTENWIKFVEPAFVGSSRIRYVIRQIMTMLFGGTKTNDQIMRTVLTQMRDYLSDETYKYINSL